jgi:hypothetical protein
LKKIIVTLLTLIFFIGCNGKQPTNQDIIVEESEKEESTKGDEKTISYQDIVMKINDINTNKKTNKRVKNIVKEYQYYVSDDDSKNSARKKALTQVEVLILEEIAVFVVSYLELSTVQNEKYEKYEKYFKEEIKNLTVGLVKTKIIDERFDGKSYYVKASVLVDPDSVSEGISEILKIKANKNEITKLNKLLQTKEHKIDMRSNETISLQKKIANQSLLNQAKAQELKSIQTKLFIAEKQLQEYNIEETRVRKELNKIHNRINTQSNKVTDKVYRGMTKAEVKSLIGTAANNPSNYEDSWIYGRLIVKFKDGTVRCVLKDTASHKICDGYTKIYESSAIVK